MGFVSFLVSFLVFLFSVFLYPDLETAINLVSTSEPLQSFIVRLPLIWLVSVTVFMAYSLLDGLKE
jgi:hypothetical protein